jgi:hypothetical protein
MLLSRGGKYFALAPRSQGVDAHERIQRCAGFQPGRDVRTEAVIRFDLTSPRLACRTLMFGSV